MILTTNQNDLADATTNRYPDQKAGRTMAPRKGKPKKRNWPDYAPLPAQILAIRSKRGLTQTQAGERVGVTQRTWCGWESGAYPPNRSASILLELLDKGIV